MQTISLIDVTLDHHRQQLLLEAARERLARQVSPPSNPRHSRAIGRFAARLSLAVMVLVASIASTVGSVLPAHASGNTVDVDLNSVYNIATIQGLNVVASAATDDASVTQSGASSDARGLWRFQPITSQNGTTQYEIVNLDTLNKCLSVYYNSTAAAGKIVIYECHSWADQLWTLTPHGAVVTIQSVSSSLYLDVPGNSAAWGTQLTQNSGALLPEQYFGLVKYSTIRTSPATYRLTTTWSLALDVASNDNDARVIQSGVLVGRPSQAWTFMRQSDGFYELQNAGSGRCLSVYYNSLQQGAGLVQYDCHGWQDQEWQVVPDLVGGLSIALRSRSNGYVADVPGGTPLNGTQLDVWTLNNGFNQVLTLTAL